jgi:hypothetical protein
MRSLLLLLVTLSACGGSLDDASGTASSESAGLLRPNTTRLGHVPGADVEVTSEALIFPAMGNQALLARQPGDVLLGAGGAGFLRRVAAVRSDGERIVVDTLPASLADAFLDARLDATLDPLGSAAPPDDDGARAQALTLRGVSYQIDDTTLSLGGGARVRLFAGRVALAQPRVELRLRLDASGVRELAVTLEGDLSAELALSAELRASGGLSEKLIKLGETPPALFTLFAGPVPIVVSTRLEVYAGARLEAEGAGLVQAGGRAASRLVASATWRDGRVALGPAPSLSVAGNGPTLSGATGRARVAAFVTVKLAIRLYDVAGPYVTVEPYLGGAIERRPDGLAFHGELGLRSLLGGEIEIVDRQVAALRAELFNLVRRFGGGAAPLPPTGGATCSGQARRVGQAHCNGAALAAAADPLAVCVAASTPDVTCDLDAAFDCICNGGGAACFVPTRGICGRGLF